MIIKQNIKIYQKIKFKKIMKRQTYNKYISQNQRNKNNNFRINSIL